MSICERLAVALTGSHTYVGFGFGAIQAGLFLFEAFHGGAFGRLVAADVVPEVVGAMRLSGGRYSVNVAHADHLEACEVGPVEMEDLAVPADRQRVVAAVAAAQEIGTAVPDVQCYVADGPGSLHRVLAQGLRRKAASDGPRAVVYTAENHNHAAERLESRVMDAVPEAERPAVRSRVRFLNTVVGKMSGVVDADDVKAGGLSAVTPGDRRAFLVEAFNRILISRICFEASAGRPAFRRGIAVFEEKADLLPFEEAKLYGHNATHALAAYVGMMLGAGRIADLPGVPGLMTFVRDAFLEESGTALIARHGGIDPLFTLEGYRRYADDLLARMTNPFLGDTVARVGRQPERKLAWDDRLIGTVRLALSQGVVPRRYAFGAAAALAALHPTILKPEGTATGVLGSLWGDSVPAGRETDAVLREVEAGLRQLRGWQAAGCPPVDDFMWQHEPGCG